MALLCFRAIGAPSPPLPPVAAAATATVTAAAAAAVAAAGAAAGAMPSPPDAFLRSPPATRPRLAARRASASTAATAAGKTLQGVGTLTAGLSEGLWGYLPAAMLSPPLARAPGWGAEATAVRSSTAAAEPAAEPAARSERAASEAASDPFADPSAETAAETVAAVKAVTSSGGGEGAGSTGADAAAVPGCLADMVIESAAAAAAEAQAAAPAGGPSAANDQPGALAAAVEAAMLVAAAAAEDGAEEEESPSSSRPPAAPALPEQLPFLPHSVQMLIIRCGFCFPHNTSCLNSAVGRLCVEPPDVPSVAFRARVATARRALAEQEVWHMLEWGPADENNWSVLEGRSDLYNSSRGYGA